MARNSSFNLPQSGRGGFTLLELLVVSVLMLVLTMMTGRMWAYFNAQVADLTNRTEAANELRLALDSISDDMGSVVWATPVDDTLVICRYGPPGRDDIIVQYAVVNQQLVRTEQATGLSVVVANKVTSLTTDNVNADLLRAVVKVGCGTTTRESTLYWSRT